MNHEAATIAYAQYVNAPRDVFAHDKAEQEMFREDTERARAEMERAWLEEHPVGEWS